MPDLPQKPTPRRFPAPWRAVEPPGGYAVETADGRHVAYVYGRDDLAKIEYRAMTRDEARRIALAIAQLPELLKADLADQPPAGT